MWWHFQQNSDYLCDDGPHPMLFCIFYIKPPSGFYGNVSEAANEASWKQQQLLSTSDSSHCAALRPKDECTVLTAQYSAGPRTAVHEHRDLLHHECETHPLFLSSNESSFFRLIQLVSSVFIQESRRLEFWLRSFGSVSESGFSKL